MLHSMAAPIASTLTETWVLSSTKPLLSRASESRGNRLAVKLQLSAPVTRSIMIQVGAKVLRDFGRIHLTMPKSTSSGSSPAALTILPRTHARLAMQWHSLDRHKTADLSTALLSRVLFNPLPHH